MFDFGKHAPFIWSSYGIVTVALVVLIAWLIWDGRRQKQALADLDARGVRRRGQATEGSKPTDQAN
jgi:heme exporter protein D